MSTENKEETGYKLSDEEVRSIAETINETVEENENLKMIANLPSNNGTEEHSPDNEKGHAEYVNVKINPETGEKTVVGMADPTKDTADTLEEVFADMGKAAENIDFDNYTISPEDVQRALSEDDIIGENYELSDGAILELIDVVNRYRNNDTIRYRDLPKEVASYLDDYLVKYGGIQPDNHSQKANELRNDLTNMLISQYESSISMDKFMDEFNGTLENAFNGINKEISSYVKDYDSKKKEYMEQICKNITDAKKKGKMEDLLDAIYDGYKLNRMRGFHIRIKKFDLEKPGRVFDIMRSKYETSKYNMYNLYQITAILNRHLVKNGYTPFGLSFILTFCKFCQNYRPENPEEHAFMYYCVYNIALLDVYHDKDYDEFAPELLENIAAICGKTKEEAK